MWVYCYFRELFGIPQGSLRFNKIPYFFWFVKGFLGFLNGSLVFLKGSLGFVKGSSGLFRFPYVFLRFLMVSLGSGHRGTEWYSVLFFSLFLTIILNAIHSACFSHFPVLSSPELNKWHKLMSQTQILSVPAVKHSGSIFSQENKAGESLFVLKIKIVFS